MEGFAQWFGDGRENKPGEQSGLINSYNGNNQDWNFKSTEAALADWRGLVFAQGKGGLGNQMWSAAATISVRIYIGDVNIIYIKGGGSFYYVYVRNTYTFRSKVHAFNSHSPRQVDALF